MRVLCYGAGAVGSLVGGRLAGAGHDVTLLGRRGHVAALRVRGLRIRSSGGTEAIKAIDSITDLDDLAEPPDLVFLTAKSYATGAALPDLARLAEQGAVVASLQNGIGNEDALAERLGAGRVIAGAVTISVSLPEAGLVEQHGPGGIALAPLDPATDVAAIADALRAAGVETLLGTDARAVKWSKLVLNLLGNATSAILDVPAAAIFGDPRLFGLERAAVLEAASVMAANGIRPIALPRYDVPVLVRAMRLPGAIARLLLGGRIARARGTKMPGLWRDLASGKGISEVGWLNGAVLHVGRASGIPTPVNRAMTQIVAGIAGGTIRWEEYRGNPERLLAVARAAQ